MKILVVEDDVFYAEQLREILRDKGVECVVARNVQEALKIDLKAVDASIIDVAIPNDPEETGIRPEETRAGFLSGVALARRIKSDHPKKPIFLFSAYVSGEAERWAEDNNAIFVSKENGPRGIISALRTRGILEEERPKAFIVHGHDEKALLALKDYIQNTLKWDEPVVLRQMPNRGKTIIEKFESYASKIDYVFVLMTPDDVVLTNDSTNEEKRRARQNVILELGFFYAHFGRQSGRVIVLHKGPLEIPSDIGGIIWIDISEGIEAAGEAIRKEVLPHTNTH